MVDHISSGQKLDFIRQQLQQYPGQIKRGESDSFVLCPFHAEKTPSARIFHSATSRSPGFLKCYGCGKTGRWDEIAPMLGLQPFTKQAPKDEYAISTTFSDKLLVDEELFVKEQMREKPLPEGKRWRGIKTSLLTALGGSLAQFYSEKYGWGSKRIYLPVIINGELSGYIKARLKKHPDYPSYVNAAGTWSKTHGLFPYDYAMKVMRDLNSSTMILVEGPRDALVLLSHGIPAVCILGTQSWSDNKSKLLALGGVETVLLMMDGDDAGISAARKIKPQLRTFFDVVKVIKLWALPGSPYLKFEDEENPSKAAKDAGVSLWDPASVPKQVLMKIKAKYFGG